MHTNILEMVEKKKPSEIRLIWTGVYKDNNNHWYTVDVEFNGKTVFRYRQDCGPIASHFEINVLAEKIERRLGYKIQNEFHSTGHHWIILKR